MTRPLRPELPPLPPHLSHLVIDDRGYPVPYFVGYVNGVPDHRVVDPPKMVRAIRESLCWICGRGLGAYKAFTIGPMCAVNRINSEPPQHLKCAHYAVRSCPFITRPQAKYREAGRPEDWAAPGGNPIYRNPGVIVIWVTRDYRVEQTPNPQGQPGVLFHLGEPTHVERWSQGREATEDELRESIETGLPILRNTLHPDDAEGFQELEAQVDRAYRVLGMTR